MLSARRFVTTVAGLGVVALFAAGCATSATAAAQVGDVTISEAAIFDRSAAMVSRYESGAETTADTSIVSSVNRTETSSAIRSQLLQVAADEQGLVITDEQVNQAVASANNTGSQLGVSPESIEQTFRDLLTLEGLLSRRSAGVSVTDVKVTVDGVSVPSRDEAVATRSQFLSDPASVDAIVAASATPIQPGDPVSLLAQPATASTGIFNAQQGDVILFPSANSYYVLRIRDHTEEPAILMASDLTSRQDISTVLDLGALVLQPVAASTPVTVNPRLGVWDPLSLQVVPGGSGL